MNLLAEILKFTLPALVVFFTSFYLLKQYINSQYNLKSLELRSNNSKDALPLKLQAYERLLLFCERISIPNLIMRLNATSMSAEDLKNSLLISVQKEYEHNMAQQLYTSNSLWEIITITKNDILSMVNTNYLETSDKSSSREYSTRLINAFTSMEKSPVDISIQGIKEEAKLILS